ncbi:hypothetical protein N482_00160 [Pseudoalteromonas luteoviolacea NCIMB 1942]|uniref:Uncharacterized protein n=1 Tax=Pseudoalteromonas luteoviolacea NCIMB 1942 TaxID=1365253 RepID=A0A167I319_9GAMM|nr:hypothetical protein N482_00160 [Pseudoalteromonas luteoviolacea NCIMB 1942]
MDRTYIFKLSGVRKAHLWTEEIKRGFASNQGQKRLAATKCLIPSTKVRFKYGSTAMVCCRNSLGKTKQEMVGAQKLLKNIIRADNQQLWFLLASKKDLKGGVWRCQRNE